MCGIFLSIAAARNNSHLDKTQFVHPNDTLRSRLDSRGPDSCGLVERTVNNHRLTFVSTVLSLRSSSAVKQPFSGDDVLDVKDVKESAGPLLLWNGEAWEINGCYVCRNDTEAVFNHLKSAVAGGEDAVVAAVNSVTGPFAFVFFDGVSRLYMARDCLGRRSLLYKTTCEYKENVLLVASVSDGTEGWQEVEAESVWVVDLASTVNDSGKLSLTRSSSEDSRNAVNGEDTLRGTAIGRHEQFLYADAGKYPLLNRSVPKQENSVAEYLTLNSPCLEHLERLLSASVKARIENIPSPPLPPQITFLNSETHLNAPSKLAILFSGGLDCTLLARLIHSCLPLAQPVDLLNVAFHNPRSHGPDPTPIAFESCPDRITARRSIDELRTCCPRRLWRLVAIDIPYTETIAHRDTVRSLMYPHNTEMDLSIAYALYFASRGIGNLEGDATGARYRTPARVLISGLGADELFGGYQRHSTEFYRHGYTALIEELDLDIKRLGKRNLGRDDRVLSHWGREARFPYLHETFVRWAVQAPVWEKCGFGQPNANDLGDDDSYIKLELEPGKLALRLLAYKLGMTRVAGEKKRAIQFGARTAKMGGSGRTKGTEQIT